MKASFVKGGVITNMSAFITIVWSLAYPFLYGLLISRLFGIKKPLDQWILVCLQISSYVISLVLFVMAGINESNLTVNTQLANAVAAVLAFYTPMFVFHGLVWQFLLRDRKLNGFLISLICCSIFVIPIIIVSFTGKFIF